MEKETAKDPCAEDRKLFAQAVREAFIRKFEAELADPVIDAQTGIELRPGDPENCPGSDEHCDECQYCWAKCWIPHAVDPQTGTELRPGDSEHCLGNGKRAGIECCCDGCDYFLACFPEWDEQSPQNGENSHEKQV